MGNLFINHCCLIFKRLLKSTDFIICITYFRKVWQNLANLPDLLNNANNI